MNIATLEIEFMAEITRLRQDMNEVRRMTQQTQDVVGGASDAMASALKGVAAGLSIGAFVAWMRSALDAADSMKAFSQKTGVAVEDVAGLSLAFQQGGVDSDKLQGAIAKMSKQVAEGGDGFKSLGVETRNADGSLRNAKDVLYDVADATAAMGDGAQKTAMLQDIFGKSAADLIPTLNEGSEGLRAMDDMAKKLGLTMSAETADAADKFNDTMDLIGDSSSGIARQVMAELLPTMNNLAGTFLSSATEGDTLKNTAAALATGLKGLFSVGYGISEVFSTVGKTIGGAGAAIMAVVSGDFAGAKNIIDDLKKDVSNDWAETGAKIQQIWSDTSNKTVEALAAVNAKGKEFVAQTKEQKDAVKDADKAYASLQDKLFSTRTELNEQISSGHKLTKTQQVLAELTANNTAEVKKLSAARRDELIAIAKNNVELEKQATKTEEARKAVEKLTKEVVSKNESLDAEIQKQLESNAKLRDGEAASIALEAAKLREAAATAQKNAVTALETQQDAALAAEYQKQADKLRELAELKEQGVHLQMAKDSAAEWKKTTDSIENGLTDSLMRGFENGKSIGDSFFDGLKAQAKALILQPTIKAIMSPVADAVGGLFGAGGGSGGTGGLGGLGSLFGGGSGGSGGILGSLGSLGKTISSYMPIVGTMLASVQLSKAISGEFKLGGLLGKITNNGLLGVAGGLLNRAFGMGDKKVKAQGIDATISGEDFYGQSFADWKQKGGWFRKDKKGTNYSALDEDVTSSLVDSTRQIYSEVEAYAKVLGLPAENMRSVSYKMRVELTEDEAKNEAAIAAAFGNYRDVLSSKFSDLVTPFLHAGESIADAMQRLAEMEAMSQDLNQFGGVFSRIASLSIDAREELIGFAGGIDALIGKTKSFVDAYYNDDEKYGIQSKQVATALKEIGIDPSQLKDKAQYRALVESQDEKTTEGRKMLAALLDLAPAFAGVADYLSSKNMSLDEAAAQAPQTALLQSLFDQSKVNTADMVDQQTLTNENLVSIEDAVRTGNSNIVNTLERTLSGIAESYGRALAGQYSDSRAVVAA